MDRAELELFDEDELADAAEDLRALLKAVAAGVLDARPATQMLLATLLERVQEALASAPLAREAVEIGEL